ncbi:uncharacterized protein DUF2812 [Acetivibrio thermocellus AD2]|uniref:Uncharacterized protein DUF2812 n=1 Tax=Acetivibrio thermocellus AD2 TaxID=1138384 RepID=A0AB36TIE8_ACETH|nr:DUF2812 domain-containing protein [Acetivibrio thermocellus]CDG36155.1 hypothetical protein CTHBC1_1514 [Acetivibrio thermocellus BC1]ADU75284.1 hypothetical protein Clo1313_2252 [Acetivibrio thermocellus DSM 1313]ALX09273.1 Protein of unknown function DUF2812 [Acetivibrio thermocellus AD2]ANV77025.1 Protein of unknown function DUF2812 [Acetivibrio thermocellus DSM 2360]EIC04741.1 hypothetical protein YSBL_1574 [Acetivibrio thermocellus YS]
MKKFKMFWNFDEEEKYLKDMAWQGYIFKKYSIFGFCHFESGKPQNLNYKIDYRIFKDKKEFDNYIALFEDAGWKHVYGTKNSGNQYFLPMNEKAGTDIFSDRVSAAARYKTLYRICLANIACFIFYLCIILFSVGGDLSKLAFLTPGLWERTGRAFWSAFFFELPFVLLRMTPLVFFMTVIVFYGYWGSKAKKNYEAVMNEDTDKE